MADENEDMSGIHWGYLNVMQLSDGTGKKMKRYLWQTFWTDLCGTTLRLYKDLTLGQSKKNVPPSTLIGPRPEDEIKYAFFCLKQATVMDFDANKYFQDMHLPRLARKNTFQIILSNFSTYLLQAPTMSALYRWQSKIQANIDNIDENLYNYERLHKMLKYERRRHFSAQEPTYPETVSEEEDKCHVPPRDPRVKKLLEKLREKNCLLRQLERQEKDFLGTDSDKEGAILRIEFAATAKKNYFLVPGRAETLIAAGETFTVFGRLGNGRWRCHADGDTKRSIPCHNSKDTEGTCETNGDVDGAVAYGYPLIGSIPTSAVLELAQPSRIKDLVDNLSLASSGTISDTSFPDTPPPSPLLSTHQTDGVVPEPYASHWSPSRSATTNQFSSSPTSSPPPTRPSNLVSAGDLNQVLTRFTIPSDSSTQSGESRSIPDTPTSPSESSIVSDLNQALESLSMLAPRTRLSSGVSTSSASSQEDSGSDMSRGARLVVSDDNSSGVDTNSAVGLVRRRKRRDIQITKKLHARGISIIVGSSSSSEDEDDSEQTNKGSNKRQNEDEKDSPLSRKIEELHASKEKLTEKVLKGPKSVSENTSKLPSADRGNVLDKPILNNVLLREFSDNSCYKLPVRNSITQAQFKPLASHETSPPLHQRRTLQMTRKEEEGFGFVLQTHSVVQTGVCADTMTFVSNVSEDGPAYLAGMRPGDVIIEIENANVEDNDQGMIVETLKSVGVTVRLVVVYKDTIRRMRLVTRLMALQARLKEVEAGYEDLERKEKAIEGGVKEPSVVNTKVKMDYIHIQTASSTFARDSPDVKNAVVQNKKTPAELLQVKQQPPLTSISRVCGIPTTGFGLVREFASSCETEDREGRATTLPSQKYASDSALNTAATKKRKTSEGSARQKALKQRQRSSFISYIDVDASSLDDDSRRRIKSEGNEPEDELRVVEGFLEKVEKDEKDEKDEKPVGKAMLTIQHSVVRPESYMFAVGTNSVDRFPLNSSNSPRAAPRPHPRVP